MPNINNSASIVVLGSGAYRIGSSVEFDWCSVTAANAIRGCGLRPIMVNYNPETVSTDYDSCDRLYFEELSLERVLDIIDYERPQGVMVSVGGQIPNNIAMRLSKYDINILGTPAKSIDRAENRHKFSQMCDALGIDQPRWKELSTIEEIYVFADEVGFPLLIRPSYVLSGAAMNVVSCVEELEKYLKVAAEVSRQYPVVVTEFIENAKEIEIDAVARQGEVLAYAISEHVEFAGVHSGDATIVFPPQKMYVETMRRIKRIAKQTAQELNITGPFNMQVMAKNNDIKVIECNLRASRSFPFVSKILKVNFIDLAVRAMLDIPVAAPSKSAFDLDYVGVKASQFSFSRLQNADPVLGVEMSSTGEVGCIGEDFHESILKAMLSVGYSVPSRNVLFSMGDAYSRTHLLGAIKELEEHNYVIYGTPGTANFLISNRIDAQMLHRADSEQHPNILDFIKERKLHLIVNIPPSRAAAEDTDSNFRIRRAAIDFNIPLITNARLASAFIRAFCRINVDTIKVKSWEEY